MTTPGPRRGLLVALEGIDGAGKSSVGRRLAGRWKARGYPVLRVAEPNDRRVGAAALRLAAKDPWASAMLFSLDRTLTADLRRRELGEPRILLQDRSYFSTLAYQGDRLAGADRRRLMALQRRIAPAPDRVVWLDLPPALAVRRISARGRPREAVERLRFLARVRRAYAGLAQDRRWLRIDASRPLDEVVERADAGLRTALERWAGSRGAGR